MTTRLETSLSPVPRTSKLMSAELLSLTCPSGNTSRPMMSLFVAVGGTVAMIAADGHRPHSYRAGVRRRARRRRRRFRLQTRQR
jgi:hypothetical protein